MSQDSPDGTNVPISSNSTTVLSQGVQARCFLGGMNVNSGATGVGGMINNNVDYLCHIFGVLISQDNNTRFNAYLAHGGINIGYFVATGQFQILFPSNYNIILTENDILYIYIKNLDGSARFINYSFLYTRIPRPSNWTKRPTAFISIDDDTPAVGQTVAFTDESIDSPSSWYWSFGDGGYSILQNPTHVYTAAGTYTVRLRCGNDGGYDTVVDSVEVT